MTYGRRCTDFIPWHYCARCDRKKLMTELEWQRGKLLCKEDCIDKLLVGDREAQINQVLSDGQVELAPDPKLQEPDIIGQDFDILI